VWESTTVLTISGSKKTTRRTEKEKREKTKKRRIEKEEIKEKLQATTSYCKEQNWTFAS
jgi:hypothetical protein